MTCLEHERDWFRAEAQRLDDICKGISYLPEEFLMGLFRLN